MSKKNLLNEAQVRQFMKLASLEPLAPGFIDGLSEAGYIARGKESLAGRKGKHPGKGEATEEEREKESEGEEKKLGKGEFSGDPEMSESHGRGKNEGAAGYGTPDNNSRLEEEEDPAELGGEMAHDLGDDSLEGDLEAAGDEEEIEAELGADEGGERTVSVDDFLAALESALEDVLGDEVEIDTDELGDEEEVEAEVELAPGGGEEMGIEAGEEELHERGATDDLVEQITKRVAARILKSALSKK